MVKCLEIMIHLNGQKHFCQQNCSLLELFEELKLDPRKYVVEHNQVALGFENYSQTRLQEDDTVEILAFMGGGERPIKGSLKKRFNEIDLYPVTCEELSCGRSDQWIVEQFLKGGAKVVQYRNKNLSDKEYLIMARRLRNLTLRYEALLIINDRVDIALEVDADGVHLGQDDLGCEKARLLLGSEKIIGVSCHSLEDAVNAQKDKATYVNVGPIFMTQTKKTSVTPVGIDLFQKVSSTIDLPVTVMGGIHADNIEMLLSVGAKKIAMVSELVQEKNVSERVHDLIEYIRSF